MPILFCVVFSIVWKLGLRTPKPNHRSIFLDGDSERRASVLLFLFFHYYASFDNIFLRSFLSSSAIFFHPHCIPPDDNLRLNILTLYLFRISFKI